MKSQRTVAFWKHHPVFDQDAKNLFKRTLDFQEATGCEFVKITPAGTWQAVCHGAQDEVWPDDPLGRRRIAKPYIEKPDDWLDLPDFEREAPPLMKEMTACCRSVVKAVASKPVVFTVFNPLTQAVQLAGLDRFKEHCLVAPEKVKAGLERITRNTLSAIDACIDAGVKGAYYVTQHMQKGLIDPDTYKEFGVPGDKDCLGRCAVLDLPIFHIHGESVFLTLPGIPENCIIHYELTDENMSPEMFHAMHPFKLMPGIPFPTMKACRSDEEIGSCIDRFSTADRDSGFVVAGCVLPLDFPESTIRRWVELGKNR